MDFSPAQLAARWDLLEPEFVRDGSLRDLYVFDASVELWDRMLAWLVEAQLPHELLRDGVPVARPYVMTEFFATRSEHTFDLHIDVGIRIAAHFFMAEEIELDVDPRELRSAQEFESLVRFVRELGQSLGREVRITPENLPAEPFLTYRYADDLFCFVSVEQRSA